jgi:peptidoglycan/LPS O-acetylase OafA/YrhL
MFGLSKTRNFGLDILRAIAILMVFIEHLDWGILNIYKPNSIFGILGVELFFVLSGFLIGGIVFKLDLETSKPSFKKFYFNRWFRTLPLYYCAFIVFQFIDAIHYQKLQIHWSYLFFLQNLFPDPHGFFAVSWSLAIEEWFYLFLPWLIYGLCQFKWTKKRLLSSLILVVGFLILIRFIYVWFLNPSFDPDLRKSVLFHFDPLLIGVILALIKIKKPKIFIKLNSLKLVLIAIAILTFSSIYFNFLDITGELNNSVVLKTFGFTWIGLWMSLLISFFFQNVYLIKKLTQVKKIYVTFTLISLFSYSIYIWHYEVNKIIYFITHMVYKTDFPQAILSLVLTGVVGYISYSFIETPFLKLRKKING